jgi:hypothetical protein
MLSLPDLISRYIQTRHSVEAMRSYAHLVRTLRNSDINLAYTHVHKLTHTLTHIK